MPAIAAITAKASSPPKLRVAERVATARRPSRRAALAAATACAAARADRGVEGAAVGVEAGRQPRRERPARPPTSMIMFSSLNGGMPNGIGRAGLVSKVGLRSGPS